MATPERLMPRLDRIDPIANARRKFGREGLFEFAKSAVKLCLVSGLLGWFLAQQGNVKGFSRAIFSGLPTCELARVIRDQVLPHTDLHGLYHVAAQPISKYDLLEIVNREYGKGLKIEPDDHLKIDRSLNASRFREATGYVAPAWPDLIAQMREFR